MAQKVTADIIHESRETISRHIQHSVIISPPCTLHPRR